MTKISNTMNGKCDAEMALLYGCTPNFSNSRLLTFKIFFSTLNMLVGRQERHPTVKNYYHNNSKSFLSGTGLTWSNSGKWSTKVLCCELSSIIVVLNAK